MHSWIFRITDHSSTPGDEMLAAYLTMMGILAWQKHGGANFAIYDSHPGYVNGTFAPMSATEASRCMFAMDSADMTLVCHHQT